MKTVIQHHAEQYTDRELTKMRDAMMKVSRRGGHIGSYDELLSGLRTAAENFCIIKLYKLGGFGHDH